MKYALIAEEQIKQIEDALTFLIMASGGETGCDHQYKICFCKEQAALSIIQSLKPSETVAWMNPYGGRMLTDNSMQNFASGLEKETYIIPLFALEQS